jgi:xanthine dehydrogenase YagR molybdenum-binding subunit
MSLLQKAAGAVLRLMPEKTDELIDSKRAVGQPLSRVDGPLKVTGRARFAAEIPLENLSYAALVYSSIARGTIASVDTAEPEAAPGVLLVMTYKNAPRLKPPPIMVADAKGAAASKLPVMQDATIRWNGEPVACVVAQTQEQADHAAALVRVAYGAEPARTSFNSAKLNAKAPDNILGEASQIAVGDAESALAKAPFRIDETYTTPRYNHGAIELHAVTVAWEDGGLLVHDATQMLYLTQSTLAAVFGLNDEKVRVLSPFVGGGFGNKAVWSHHILAAAAAKLVDRPVRLMLTREGVFRATGGRTLTEQRVALGAKEDGRLAALIHTGVAGVTDHNYCPEQFTFPARHLYAADNFLISQKIAPLDMVANTFMRAPGESVGTFALESAIDELACAISIDPVELRRRCEPEKDPTSGLPFSSRNLVEAYRRGAERFGWDRRKSQPRTRRDGEWLIGCGVATGTYPYYRMPGGAASITLTVDGRAIVRMGAHEMGMGTATVQAQHAAERLGLRVEQVTFEYGDTDLPSGTMAGGSSQSASIIAAVTAASEELVKQLLKLAGNDSPLAGLKPAQVEARDAGLCSRDNPTHCETYASILHRAGKSEFTCEASAPLPLEMMNPCTPTARSSAKSA